MFSLNEFSCDTFSVSVEPAPQWHSLCGIVMNFLERNSLAGMSRRFTVNINELSPAAV